MAYEEVGVQRFTIRLINPNIYNALIVGIIIGKSRPRVFTNSKQNGERRGVWNFTMRDSIQDYINVTCWGLDAVVVQMDNSYHIGDVGKKNKRLR